MKFAAAVANWRSATRPPPITGWKSTCGSAERLYASAPERHPVEDDVNVWVDLRAADKFERLVSQLPPDQRLAWHARNGFRTTERSEEWINEHYNQARAQLSVWWSHSHL